jgi:VanZ family protein
MSLKSYLPAVVWLIISAVLLALPGNDLPHGDFLNIPFFDKYVHLGMFLLLTVLFCYPLVNSGLEKRTIRSRFIKITVLAILYGVMMEYVQLYLVYGRSFDVMDIVFDAIGSLAGYLAITWYYHKKIGPDGNRGRNQN